MESDWLRLKLNLWKFNLDLWQVLWPSLHVHPLIPKVTLWSWWDAEIQELSSSSLLFHIHRDHKDYNWDGEPRTVTWTFTQLLSSDQELTVTTHLYMPVSPLHLFFVPPYLSLLFFICGLWRQPQGLTHHPSIYLSLASSSSSQPPSLFFSPVKTTSGTD